MIWYWGTTNVCCMECTWVETKEIEVNKKKRENKINIVIITEMKEML